MGLKLDGRGLEIGPSYNPITPKRAGYNVEIVDHLDTISLRKKYSNDPNVDINNMEEVNYVSSGEPLQNLIGAECCFDWIIASHVIEHVPDFVGFLQQCESLLTNGGILSLVVPDQRYCFDRLQPWSTAGAVLDAHMEKRIRPSLGCVFDHFANTCSSDGNITWSEEQVPSAMHLIHPFSQAVDAFHSASGSVQPYLDVHCWRFIPELFRLVIEDLRRLGLLSLLVKPSPAPEGCEFYVQLEKHSLGALDHPDDLDRAELLTSIMRKLAPANDQPS